MTEELNQALRSALRFAASYSAITSQQEQDILAAWNTRATDLTERAAIVAWLRDQWRDDALEIECLDIADAIEAGEHRP